MHKQRLGGGARRPAAAKLAETASAQWQSLIASHIALCQLILDEMSDKLTEQAEARAEADEEEEEEDEEEDMEGMVDMLTEQISALDSVKKKKLPFAERMGVIGMIDELYAELLESVAEIDSEDDGQRGVELQVEELFATALTSTLAYCADCLSRSGGPAKAANKLQADSEDETLMAMKLLSTVISTTVQDSKYVRSALQTTSQAIVKLLLGIGLNENRNSMVRGTAFAVLSEIIESASMLFSPNVDGGDADVKPLIDAMLDACYSLCSDLNAVDLDDEKGQNQNFGTSLLDVLATNILPNSYVAQMILDRSTRGLETEKDRECKGALVCLAVLPSSAPSFADSHAKAVWSVIEKGLNHSTMIVRASALVAAGELVENSEVAYAEFGRAVSDAAWNALDDKEQPVYLKLRACAALTQVIGAPEKQHHHHDHDGPCSHDHKKPVVEVADVVPRVVALMENVHASSSDAEAWQLTESLVNIIHAAIESDEVDSIDHKSLVQTLLSVLARADEDPSCNAARAVMTAVIAAVTEDESKAKEIVTTHGTSLVNVLKSNAAIEDFDVRSATHRCWISIASAVGADMVAHLGHIVPTITRVFSEEYTPGGAPSSSAGHDDDDEEGSDNEEMDYDEEKMEAEEEEAKQVDEERIAALALYRELIEVLGAQMLEFNEEIWSGIVDQSADWSGLVQEQVAEVIPSLAKLFPRTSEAKFIVGESSQLPAGAESVVQSAVKLMLTYIRFAVDASAAAKAIDAIAGLIDEFGQVVLMQPIEHHDAFFNSAKRILDGKAICQQNMGGAIPAELREQIEAASGFDQGVQDNEDEDDDAQLVAAFGADDEEMDGNSFASREVLIRSLVECLAAFAKARGPAFQSEFTDLFPLLLKAGTSWPSAYAFGCMAEITACLSLPSNPVWADEMVTTMLKTLTEAIDVQHLEAARNCVYSLGAVLLNGQEALSKHAKDVVAQAERLITLCDSQLASATEHSLDDDARSDLFATRDNGASAIAKALLASPSNSELLNSSFAKLLAALPIVEDIMEQSVPLSLIVKLINQKNDIVQQHKARIIEIFTKVLSQPVGEDRESSESEVLTCPRSVHDYVQKALDSLQA